MGWQRYHRNIAFGRTINGFLLYLLPLMALAIILSGCKTQDYHQQPLDRVTLQFKWLHQTQFAGFYMAKEKGYYAQEGIEVVFLEGGPDIDVSEKLAAGKADFGITSPEEVLIRRSQGDPLAAIAAIFRRSAVVFLSKQESAIIRPQDFTGKTVATAGTGGATELQVQFLALVQKLEIDIEQINIIPHDSLYTAFLNGEADVTAAYCTVALIRLRQQGLSLNVIWPADYDIHFYSDLVATTDDMMANHPDLVTRFLRASLKGWQSAVDDYHEAVDISLHYAREADPELQTAMMEAMLPLVHTGEGSIGWMEPEIWQGMYNTLYRHGIITQPLHVRDAYTMQFLEEAYGSSVR